MLRQRTCKIWDLQKKPFPNINLIFGRTFYLLWLWFIVVQWRRNLFVSCMAKQKINFLPFEFYAFFVSVGIFFSQKLYLIKSWYGMPYWFRRRCYSMRRCTDLLQMYVLPENINEINLISLEYARLSFRVLPNLICNSTAKPPSCKMAGNIALSITSSFTESQIFMLAFWFESIGLGCNKHSFGNFNF